MKNFIDKITNQYPEFTINLKVSDLIACNRQLIEEVRQEFERQAKEVKPESYLTPDQTASFLNVTKTTLWRWAKKDYLTPIEIGGKRRYKMSDIKNLLNESHNGE